MAAVRSARARVGVGWWSAGRREFRGSEVGGRRYDGKACAVARSSAP